MTLQEKSELVWVLNPHQVDLISTKPSVELGKNMKSYWAV